jgi:formaldehyde-activating enzyme involved in methanogenesis
MDAECDCGLRTADRFVCRREGHTPLLRVTRHNVNLEPGATYITPCQRCGQLYEELMPEAE